MGKAESTTEHGIAPWDQIPDMKQFWDAYVEMFWGTGGGTPYHDMLVANQDWLREAYLANHEVLTAAEQQYVNATKETVQQYETGIEESRVPVSLGGKTFMRAVPAREQSVQGDLLKVRQGALDKGLVASSGQAARQLGMLPEPGAGSVLADALGVGLGVLDLFEGLAGVGAKHPGVWDAASDWGSDVWSAASDWGSDFLDWLFG
jgi:hypothetical protein